MRRILFVGFLVLFPGLSVDSSRMDSESKSRTFILTQNIKMKSDAIQGKKVSIWIPALPSFSNQQAKLKSIKSPLSHRMRKDPDFGNSVMLFQGKKSLPEEIEIEVAYEVRRTERRASEAGQGKMASLTRRDRALYLAPRGLVVINDEIKEIADKIKVDSGDPYLQARAIYNYVLSRMDYDKSGTGWGNGDVLYACEFGKGNCTDFHSLFIAISRASNIPTRFKMGVPIPQESGRKMGAYHCWAEFYLDDKGWIPVDISEAWKYPQKADYFFGNLDEHRVLVSLGRDIQLPSQKGPNLNYFINPYVEVDGKPYTDFRYERQYHINGGG